MTVIRPLRSVLRAFAAAAAAIPGTAQSNPDSAARSAPETTFLLELGVRSSDDPLLGAFWKAWRKYFDPQLADPSDASGPVVALWRFMNESGAEVLPFTARAWFDSSAVGSVPTGIVQLDLNGQPDLEKLLGGKPGVPLDGLDRAWQFETGYLRQLDTDSGTRFVILTEWKDPVDTPCFAAGAQLPLPRGAAHMLDSVRGAPFHLFVDLPRVLRVTGSKPSARQLLSMSVGPRGGMVAMALRAGGNRLILDILSSITPGQGTFGILLPADAGDARPIGTPPFEPALMALADLGPSAARTVQGLGFLSGVLSFGREDGPPLEHIAELAEVLNGRVAVYVDTPADDDWTPTIVAVAGLVDDGAEDAVRSLRAIAGDAERREDGLFVQEHPSGMRAFGAMGRRLVSVESAADAPAIARKVLAAREDPALPEELAGDRAAIKVLVRHELAVRLGESYRPLAGESEAYYSGNDLARYVRDEIATGALVLKLGWDRAGTHLRLEAWQR